MKALATGIRWFGYVAASLIALWGLLVFSWQWEALLYVALPIALVVGFTYIVAWAIDGFAKPKA